jgi:hypothetical protein
LSTVEFDEGPQHVIGVRTRFAGIDGLAARNVPQYYFRATRFVVVALLPTSVAINK